MTDSSVKNVANFTCHSFVESHKQTNTNFCGKCDSCEIESRLARLKLWFDRASQNTHKRLLNGLLLRMLHSKKVSVYLEDVITPLSNYSKDLIYARNKYLPSLHEDATKVTNDRCLTGDYISKEIETLWSWYTQPTTTDYAKINFFLSVLQRCEQSVVLNILKKLKESSNLTKSSRTIAVESTEVNVNDEENESELVYDDLTSSDDEIEMNNRRFIHRGEHENTYVDFIRYLPVHLSKKILSILPQKQLYNCLFVSKYWCDLTKEVHKEEFLHKILIDDMMLLKGTSPKGTNPCYANNVDVKVPNLKSGSHEVMLNSEEAEVDVIFKSECSWINAYAGYSTRNVIMEERNVLCGTYNVLVMKENFDRRRVCHLNGPTTIAYSSTKDQKLRFIDIRSYLERATPVVQGHAGSIKSVYVYEKKRLVITGSYDTTVRVWSIDSGKCMRIYQGHQRTVTCLSFFEPNERLISGSVDRTCKVWLLKGKRKNCWRTFKHQYQILSCAIGEEICVSGGINGKIKVFDLANGRLIKKISAHQGPVTQVRFDRWHLVSCSTDSYALVYSTQGKHKKCIIALRHPKPVLCLEYVYLRVITGSSDGKLRIWNILNGECLRVLRGNSQCDPIKSLSLTLSKNESSRLLINTDNAILLMEFEKTVYNYSSSPYLNTNITMDHENKTKKNKLNKYYYPYVRASRSELVCTPNVKLFKGNTTKKEAALEHSARPISSKNLKDAKLVHRVMSSQFVNVSPNLLGHISDLVFLKRQEVFRNSINSTIQEKKSSFHSSVIRLPNVEKNSFDTSSTLSRETYQVPINTHVSCIQFKAESTNQFAQEDKTDLAETKRRLRDQLKEIKQFEQRLETTKMIQQFKLTVRPKIKSVGNKDDNSKSCIYLPNRSSISSTNININAKHYQKTRPQTSPSRFDTRTRIRLTANDLENIILLGKINSVTTQPLQQNATSNTTTDGRNLKNQLTKISRIPDKPKSQIRPVTAITLPHYRFKSSLTKLKQQNTHPTTTLPNHQHTISRIQTATTSTTFMSRPPTSRLFITVSSELKQLPKDELNLMTFKQVETLMNLINVRRRKDTGDDDDGSNNLFFRKKSNHVLISR